jgi:DNA-binding NarL/FixJ family response regulator
MSTISLGLNSKRVGNKLGTSKIQTASITAALVDSYGLSRDCIICAIHALGSSIKAIPFSSICECINYADGDLNVIVYYCHHEESTEHLTGQEITTLRQAFSDVPIIVLSDAKPASLPKVAKMVIRAGARGFIPTRTLEMQNVPSSIRYVAEGGTVVPVDILFADKEDCAEMPEHDMMSTELTSRQKAVLSHLRQGKPNKIIAHDLRMSESTVKVHVRNIMRRMGATNRTQAVYRARQFNDGQEAERVGT